MSKLHSKTNKQKEIAGIVLVIVTIFLGWQYPVLGFIVPVVMVSAIVVSMLDGRYHCGNVCPRGMFLTAMLRKVSQNKAIPGLFFRMWFRLTVMALLMTFMVFRIAQDIASYQHIGHVFWLMCAVTTGIGLIIGALYKPRSWCAVCPIGTIQKIIGNHNKVISLNKTQCINCKACEKKCPIDIRILSYAHQDRITHSDCFKCSACIQACPKKALSWDSVNKKVA